MNTASEVFFTDLRTHQKESLLIKVDKLIRAAGIEKINMEKKFIAVKVHMGESGNMSYLRPNYARVIVDLVKEKGGMPFITDCSTLYVGRRKNALEHLDVAYENGYNPFTTGCHTIIADGLKGSDDVDIEIKGKYFKKAKIGRAIADSDVIISLNHFKGHELTGFGGAIKNLGMGCASKSGKVDMHSTGKPEVNASLCKKCEQCLKACANSAIIMNDIASINKNNCVGCGRCISACSFDAISAPFDTAQSLIGLRVAEYAYAAILNKPNFHISFVIDVSPFCDCYATNDLPIVPDVGIFASFDPVALDVACADAVNGQHPIAGSIIDRKECDDKFKCIHPQTDWNVAVKHAEELGIGTRKYKLIKI